DGDLNWYNYSFRNYDPQIGRFVQLDPLTDYYPLMTPYQYASNDPIANINIDGLEGGSAIVGVARVGESFGLVTAASEMSNIIVTTTRAVGQASSWASTLAKIGSYA